MEFRKANPIRRWVRTIVAAYFWFAPLLRISPFHFPSSWSYSLATISRDAFLILFIAYYALLSEGGWFSVAFDLLFIYFWPLVLAWEVLKKSGVTIYQGWKRAGLLPRIEGIKELANRQSEDVKSSSLKEIVFGDRMISRIIRPFTQFILLWALLVLDTSSPLLTWIALAIIAVGSIKIVRNLSLFLADAEDWIAKLKSNFAIQVANNIAKVRSYTQGADPESFVAPANSLHTFEIIFRYMAEQKSKLAKWSLIWAVVITVPFYLYLSFVFTSIYLGVAHLNHVNWNWTDALTTSIFIPFAFTDLPHNFWIRLIGGIHALIVTLLGYTVLYRRIHQSVQELTQAATELYKPLNDDGLRTTVASLNVVKVKQVVSQSSATLQDTPPAESAQGT